MAGLSGPIIPAGLAPLALRLLRQGYAAEKSTGETVRVWAERIGKEGIERLLAPLRQSGNDRTFLDWGDDAEFKGAPTLRGECAAPFASDDLLANYADDALIRIDRWSVKSDSVEAVKAAEQALVWGARRLLHLANRFTTDDADPHELLHDLMSLTLADGQATKDAYQRALAVKSDAERGGSLFALREAVALALDHVRSHFSSGTAHAEAAE
jgi:sulfite reductase (NADPH) hemoprotein beta-component